MDVITTLETSLYEKWRVPFDIVNLNITKYIGISSVRSKTLDLSIGLLQNGFIKNCLGHAIEKNLLLENPINKADACELWNGDVEFLWSDL